MSSDQIAALAAVVFITLIAFGGWLGLRAACHDHRRKTTKPTGCGELW